MEAAFRAVKSYTEIDNGETALQSIEASYAVEAIYMNSDYEVLKYVAWGFDSDDVLEVKHSKDRTLSSWISDTNVAYIDVTIDLEKNQEKELPTTLSSELGSVPYEM